MTRGDAGLSGGSAVTRADAGLSGGRAVARGDAGKAVRDQIRKGFYSPAKSLNFPLSNEEP